MLTLIIQKLISEKHKPCLLCLPGYNSSFRNSLTFDPEFSLPPGFFEKELLEACDRCESPAKERMQTENHPSLKPIALH